MATNLRIVYKKADGSVAITTPVSGTSAGPSPFEMLTGTGGFPASEVESEISKLVNIDGKDELKVRPFYEGLVNGGFTEMQAMDLIANHAWESDYVSYRITPNTNIPTTQLRSFRDAWTDDNPGDTVDVDITKAKEIKKEEFRKIRDPLLATQDVEMFKALEGILAELNLLGITTTSMESIRDLKQQLRDVTALALPDDPVKLDNFMPAILQ